MIVYDVTFFNKINSVKLVFWLLLYIESYLRYCGLALRQRNYESTVFPDRFFPLFQWKFYDVEHSTMFWLRSNHRISPKYVKIHATENSPICDSFL